MAKPTTDFTPITKNLTGVFDTSKNPTDTSIAAKVTSDFALNSSFESGATWDSSTVDWGSLLVSWDGADGASPLGGKDSTDFSSTNKVSTDVTDYNKLSTDFTQSSKVTTDITDTTKLSTDLATPSKGTTDFDLNSTVEDSYPAYDDATIAYDDPLINYDGSGAGYSSLGTKATTDFTQASKNTSDFTDII